MLKDSPMYATIPVSDLTKSRKFYEEEVGLGAPSRELPDGGVVYDCGSGTGFSLYPTKENAGKSPVTLATWVVADCETEVKDLKSRGVTFEEYDTPPTKTVDGIATFGDAKGAWFKDPDGNILGDYTDVVLR